MSRISKPATLLCASALALSLVAPLAGCSGATPAVSADPGAWLVTNEKVTQTRLAGADDNEGPKEATPEFTVKNTYDEQGNLTERVEESAGKVSSTQTYTYEEGWPISTTYATDEEQSEATYTNEYDDKGLLVRQISESGLAESVFEYDENGFVLKETDTTYRDENGKTSGDAQDVTTIVITYDPDGTIKKREYDQGGVKSLQEFVYVRDASNKPITCKITTYGLDDKGNKTPDQDPMVQEIHYSYDKNGNPTMIETEYTGYKVVSELEYTYVKDPSPWARNTAHQLRLD